MELLHTVTCISFLHQYLLVFTIHQYENAILVRILSVLHFVPFRITLYHTVSHCITLYHMYHIVSLLRISDISWVNLLPVV